MARPSSASNASRLATSTTLIPDAAICRANSLPIPDEAPVTSAHGPNCLLSSAALIVLFLSVDCTCYSIEFLLNPFLFLTTGELMSLLSFSVYIVYRLV